MRTYRAKPKIVEAEVLRSGDYIVVGEGIARVVARDAFEEAFEPFEPEGARAGVPLVPSVAEQARALAGITKLPAPRTYQPVLDPRLLEKIDPKVIAEAERQEALPPHAQHLGPLNAQSPPGRDKGKPRRQPKEGLFGRYCTKCHQKSGGPRSLRCANCMEKF